MECNKFKHLINKSNVMKRIILIMLLAFGVFSIVPAQEMFTQGSMHIHGDVYDVRVNDDVSIIGVSNLSKNKKDIPKLKKEIVRDLLPIKEGDIKLDTAKEREIVLDILFNKKEILKSNKEAIGIRYIFYPNGQIMNIDFVLMKATVITPAEISAIDRCLRKEIKASFSGEEYKSFPVIPYSKKWLVF